jgi:hypothetical protein
VVFWLILKWEDNADNPHSDRWLVLIAYLVGLSIGVHLLNLLCIPAIVLVVYYKRCPDANVKGSLVALLGSIVIIAAVLYGVVPGIVRVGGWFELFFVNALGFSFNTGLIIYLVILVAVVLWAIYESNKNADGTNHKRMNISFLASLALLGLPFYGSTFVGQLIIGIILLVVIGFILFRKYKNKYIVSARTMNTALLCMLMLMIGYSSYSIIVIRSTANPPMDQNSPEDIFTLGQYLGREQYGSRPLFYGQAYTSKLKYVPSASGDYYEPASTKGEAVYQRVEKKNPNEKDRYEVAHYQQDYIWAQNMLFPRMYDADHAQAYEDWMGGVEGTNVSYTQPNGEVITVKMPTQFENLKFFFSYQLNWMYWRYFMWNFAGRQNDFQGNGETEHGNWVCGIPFIDNARLGDQSKLPTDLKENKGHNVFYCLPLILGLLGLFWQVYKGKDGVKQFWVVFFLFFMTGIAIVIYLNQTPMQPRERDYAYAGSFYAFTIWIGLGVAAIYDWLKRIKVNEALAASLATIACVLIPIQMAGQTWDDHDRSGRFTCRDFGRNYLMTLQSEGNPIIFTNGDNDTFPLWYNQETEGVRTDVRVCNLSYLQTDWYIDQMKRPAYNSPSVPIHWKRLQYVEGANDYIPVQPEVKAQVLDLYKQHPAEARAAFGDDPFELKNIIEHWILNPVDEDSHLIPTDTIYVNIDKNAVRRSGMMMAGDSIPSRMIISLKGKRSVIKSELMMLEMLAQTNWVRPLYVAITVGSENYMNLGDNFVQEGLAYRITPFNTKLSGRMLDSNRMYDNLMNKYRFGGVENPKAYFDENIRKMIYTHRRMFGQLAQQLIIEGQKAKAMKALDYCAKVIPASTVPHDIQSGSLDLAKAYVQLGAKNKAMPILNDLTKRTKEYINWYLSLTPNRLKMSAENCLYNIYMLSQLGQTMQQCDAARGKALINEAETFARLAQSKGVSLSMLEGGGE